MTLQRSLPNSGHPRGFTPVCRVQYGLYDTFNRWYTYVADEEAHKGPRAIGVSKGSFVQQFVCGLASGILAKVRDCLYHTITYLHIISMPCPHHLPDAPSHTSSRRTMEHEPEAARPNAVLSAPQLATHPLDVVKKRYQVAGLQRSLTYGERITAEVSTYMDATAGWDSQCRGCHCFVGFSVPWMPLLHLANRSTPARSPQASHPVIMKINLKHQAPSSPPTSRHASPLQTATEGLYKTLRHILAREGLSGLYKGLAPSVIKAAPAAAVTFVVYEWAVQELAPLMLSREELAEFC